MANAFGIATHLFRIGGVTTLTSVDGVAADGEMRSWYVQAMALYVHLARAQRAHGMIAMAEVTDVFLEELSCLVGRLRR